MKSSILLFSLLLLLALPFLGQAQGYDPQYVTSVSGDTLLVKSDFTFKSANTLYLLMKSDSNAPATRVYMLESGGTYSLANNPVTNKDHKDIIMGPVQNIKTATTYDIIPPVVCGSYATGGANSAGGININKDLLVKNIDFEIGNTNGIASGWTFFNIGGPNEKLQVDNCIMEHTFWVWVGGPPKLSVVKFTNDYMVNLGGHNCRRNGGVTDFNSGSAFLQDTLLVENCTHVNIQGTLYKFRDGYVVNRAIFNHNDFIDCSGYVIMNNGDQTNLSITNNIYVNTQLQDFCPVLSNSDKGEVDDDALPMGLINLKVDSTFTANVISHGVYVDKNLAYWDASLSDIDATLNTNSIDHSTAWVSQRIIANTRTTGLFANATYPTVLNKNRGWISKLPTFNNTSTLFTTQLAVLKAYAIATVDTSYGTPLKSWRVVNTPESSNFVYADFPLPINLSYTDSDLLTAGIGGYPLGDLGWFPATMATWKAQAAAEYAAIQVRVDSGRTTGILSHGQVPNKLQLDQNYPNPFNPTTNISYTLSNAGNVTLKVYNVLGQEVATLVNGYQNANSYTVPFNASKLASGVYMYTLSSGSNMVSKKMVLMK